MSRKLKTTSSRHMAMLITLGSCMSPAHLSTAAERLYNWKKGRAKEKMRKYIEASCAMSVPPPSQKGRGVAMHIPPSMTIKLNSVAVTNPVRITSRALAKSFAPMKCATCTENPIEVADVIPPISHVVVSTMPIAAEARAPKLPTMAWSMKNMTTAESCASMDGILSERRRRILSLPDIILPLRISARSCSLFFFEKNMPAKLLQKGQKSSVVCLLFRK